MRTLLAFCCLALPAQAGTLEYALIGNGGSSSGIVTPRSAFIQLRNRSDQVLVAEWRIDGIMPSLEPQVWSLTEADNHPAWPLFEAAAYNPDAYDWRGAFNATTPSGNWTRWRTKPPADQAGPGDRDYFWYEMYDLQRIDFTLEHWLLGVSERRNVTFIGEGAALPEPTTGLLLLLGLLHTICLLSARRRSRHSHR